jgi:hypothetical protein
MKPEIDAARLVRDVRWLKAYSVASSLALIVLLVSAQVPAGPQRVAVLDVERLNVLNADGSPALVLAGRGRLPGPTFEKREYPQELSGGRTTASGMIFFNERGDEVGGLTYHGQLAGDRYRASGTLMFDQFRQDQTVGIQYSDDGLNRSAGLNVWDRSTQVSIGRLLELVDARARATGAARDSVQAEINRLGQLPGGGHRIFLGSRDRNASLLIRDTAGRVRIRLFVDAQDAARLEFLDAQGNVAAAFPG